MKSPSKKLVRSKSRTPKEDADPVGSARIYVEVDAGTARGGPVSIDLRIMIHPRNAHGFAHVVGELKTPSAELSDELRPDQQPDAPEDGPYIVTLFGERVPVSQLKTRRRRLGRRR